MARAGALGAVLVAALLVLPALALTAAPASADSGGGQTTSGPELVGKALPDGDFMVLWTPDPIASIFTPGYFSPGYISDGALLYGTPLGISVYDPSPVASALVIHLVQFSASTQVVKVPRTVGNQTFLANETVPVQIAPIELNATIQLLPRQVNALVVDVPRTPTGTTRDVVVSAENVSWSFQHLTPDFIVPVSNTFGGVTLLAIGESLWTILLLGIATVLARSTQRRIPGIGHWKRGPSILGGALFGSMAGWFVYDLAIQSPQFFETVGGSSFLVYPAAFAFLWYLGVQGMFVADEATIIAHPVLGRNLSFVFNDNWRVTRGADGSDYLARNGFWGWFWPLLGYPKEIDLRRNPAPESTAAQEGPAASVDLLWEERGEIDKRQERVRRLHRQLRKLGAMPPDPERLPLPPAFPVRGLRATTMYWVDSDQSIRVEWQHFRLFEEVARHGADGQVLRDAAGRPVTRRRFRPHVQNDPARLRLAGIHWLDALAVSLGFRSAEELARNLEKAEMAVIIQERRIDAESTRKAAERVEVVVRRTQYRHLATVVDGEVQEARELTRRAGKPKTVESEASAASKGGEQDGKRTGSAS